MQRTQNLNDNLSDKEYFAKLGVKQLPPSREDVRDTLKSLRFQQCTSDADREGFSEVARDVMEPEQVDELNPSDYYFLSAQSLVPIYERLGYDLRSALDWHGHDFLDQIVEEIEATAELKRRRPSGVAAEVNGQAGYFFDREWLLSAGIDPKGRWQDRTSQPPQDHVSRA